MILSQFAHAHNLINFKILHALNIDISPQRSKGIGYAGHARVMQPLLIMVGDSPA